MNIDVISSVIKMFFIVMFTSLISIKLLNCNYSKKNIILIFLESLLLSIVYIIVKNYINIVISLCIICLFISYFIKLLNIYKNGHSMLVVVISMAICLMAFGLAVVSEFSLYKIFHIENNIINSLLIAFIQGILIFSFLKTKRFSKGFSFLQNKNEYIDIIMINISTIIIFVYFLLGNYYHKTAINMFIMFTFLGMFMVMMINEAFSMQYKQNLLKKELEACKEEIELKDNEIKKLSNEKFEISKINHEFYNRQKALELNVRETLLNANMETAEELEALSRVEILTKEYYEAMKKIKGKTKLPKTDITEIDDMFNYMQTECINNNIDFDLKINGNIHYLINHYIPKNKLETMIGDHIRDAIIAIDSSNNKNKSILVILGTKENCYELCVYDTGIEFEIDTLLKLGLERTTTHKETGGSGIGFMTTFETMKECRASLIIEEKPISDNNYTKSVTIRFDGKNDYKIISYRAEKIKQKNKSGRIIVEKFNK